MKKNVIKVAVLAIAGACLTAFSYISGIASVPQYEQVPDAGDDEKDSDEAPSDSNSDEEEIASDTQ